MPGDEKKLSMAAWSQTFPERLIEQMYDGISAGDRAVDSIPVRHVAFHTSRGVIFVRRPPCQRGNIMALGGYPAAEGLANIADPPVTRMCCKRSIVVLAKYLEACDRVAACSSRE